MTVDEFGDLVVVVSRQDVENGDTSAPLAILKRLVSTPDMIRSFRTRVGIAFDGYNQARDELFEIPEVRDFVHALDTEFPYWLYFLSREYSGFQCIVLCFLPPYLTDEARARIHTEKLATLIERRWGPALNHICTVAGLPDAEADALLESALKYFKNGPIRRKQ